MRLAKRFAIAVLAIAAFFGSGAYLGATNHDAEAEQAAADAVVNLGAEMSEQCQLVPGKDYELCR